MRGRQAVGFYSHGKDAMAASHHGRALGRAGATPACVGAVRCCGSCSYDWRGWSSAGLRSMEWSHVRHRAVSTAALGGGLGGGERRVGGEERCAWTPPLVCRTWDGWGCLGWLASGLPMRRARLWHARPVVTRPTGALGCAWC